MNYLYYLYYQVFNYMKGHDIISKTKNCIGILEYTRFSLPYAYTYIVGFSYISLTPIPCLLKHNILHDWS